MTNITAITNLADGQVLYLTNFSSVPSGVNAPGMIFQDLPTQAGLVYLIQFALRGPIPDPIQLRVLWDNQLVGMLSNATVYQWTVTNFTATANGSTSRLTFENVTPNQISLELDAISVTSLTEPASIIAQPQSRSAFMGSAVAYRVIAGGMPPLYYQWLHEGAAIPGETGPTLTITNVQAASAGTYEVVVTNTFGTVTSRTVSLVVDSMPQEPLFVIQPDGRRLAAGYSVSLVALAVGVPELHYQWHKDGVPLAGRTNATFAMTNLTEAHSGVYHAIASNRFGMVMSLPATLTVTNGVGGGQFTLYNGYTTYPFSAAGFAYDTDGTTRLAGTNFVAQAYAGSSQTDLHAVGPIRPFAAGDNAGLYLPLDLTLPDFAVFQMVCVQVRVWERSRGETYEAARVWGGRYGCSEVLKVQCGGPPPPGYPPLLQVIVLQSRPFLLQAGQPFFSTGRIKAEPPTGVGVLRWSLTGEPNTTYLVEQRVPPANWLPLQLLTNMTGIVSFQVTNSSGVNASFYRARLLD